MNEAPELLQSFLKHPGESARVDYKAGVAFDEKSDFALKLAKHCQGFTNSGGGYIVLGFREGDDGHPRPDPDLSEAVVKSYDVTRVAQHVNSFLAGQDSIDMTIYKIEHEGRRYPIISIRPFSEQPVFCGKTIYLSDREEILRQGAVYVRDREAKTTIVAGPVAWRALIESCIVAKRGEFIKALKVALEPYVKLDLRGADATPDQWIEEVRMSVLKRLQSSGGRNV
ncbi:MAG: putative DNA binding domain-containing protein [Candidatus Omnitrophica bacterium]|nr:putative DNA binding domain-containing protein [Candidatus Omnitrophota bacterium]